MANVSPPIVFRPCPVAEVFPHLGPRGHILVDSFWEAHVRESSAWRMESGGQGVGGFAVHRRSLLTLFHVAPGFRGPSQELFSRVLRWEEVREAFVPTGDEFFLSHALDQAKKVENQAYFSLYDGPEPDPAPRVDLRRADLVADAGLFPLAEGFLEEEVAGIESGLPEEIWVASHGGEVVGFGVVEEGRLVPGQASIGMFVRPPFRGRGHGTAILLGLKHRVLDRGLKPVSGCWYYNHNSRKTMGAAGASSSSRLLKITF